MIYEDSFKVGMFLISKKNRMDVFKLKIKTPVSCRETGAQPKICLTLSYFRCLTLPPVEVVEFVILGSPSKKRLAPVER